MLQCSKMEPMPSRYFNPIALWADVAAKTGDMLLSSSTVVQIRTGQLWRGALASTDVDLHEFGLMGQEKVAAVSESGSAMVSQLHATQFALTHRAVRQALQAGEALAALMVSTSPAQAATQARRLLSATSRSAATATQLSSAGARIAQRGLRPIYSRATSNATRLLKAQAPVAAE
jgi:hypothetical protein